MGHILGALCPIWELGEGWGGLRGPLKLHLQMWVCQESQTNEGISRGGNNPPKGKAGRNSRALENSGWCVLWTEFVSPTHSNVQRYPPL